MKRALAVVAAVAAVVLAVAEGYAVGLFIGLLRVDSLDRRRWLDQHPTPPATGTAKGPRAVPAPRQPRLPRGAAAATRRSNP